MKRYGVIGYGRGMGYGTHLPANRFGGTKNLWGIGGYGLGEVWVKGESTVLFKRLEGKDASLFVSLWPMSVTSIRADFHCDIKIKPMEVNLMTGNHHNSPVFFLLFSCFMYTHPHCSLDAKLD